MPTTLNFSLNLIANNKLIKYQRIARYRAPITRQSITPPPHQANKSAFSQAKGKQIPEFVVKVTLRRARAGRWQLPSMNLVVEQLRPLPIQHEAVVSPCRRRSATTWTVNIWRSRRWKCVAAWYTVKSQNFVSKQEILACLFSYCFWVGFLLSILCFRFAFVVVVFVRWKVAFQGF